MPATTKKEKKIQTQFHSIENKILHILSEAQGMNTYVNLAREIRDLLVGNQRLFLHFLILLQERPVQVLAHKQVSRMELGCGHMIGFDTCILKLLPENLFAS